MKVLIAIVVVVAAAIGYFYFSRPVALVTDVSGGTAYKAVPGSVTVQAEFDMELKSEVGGRVIKSDLDPGKKVKAGEVLCQLDPGGLELEIESVQNQYEAAKKRVEIGSPTALDLANAEDDLANYERLNKSGNFSDADLVKKKREVKQIEQKYELEKVNNAQTLESLENTLKVKKRQLAQMTIMAPFDGQVSEVYARPGDIIGANTPIATLISTSRTVEARISEENFADISMGQNALVTFLPYGAWIFHAKVTKILPTADPQTQRYIVYLEVNDIDPDKLVPGITGEVTITVGERKAKALIPRRALFGSNVYLVKDGRVELQRVKTGYVSLTTVEITEGLKPGDQVIVDQLDQFRDGERVRAELIKSAKPDEAGTGK